MTREADPADAGGGTANAEHVTARRRTLLRVALATGGAGVLAGLAGCSALGGGNTKPQPDDGTKGRPTTEQGTRVLSGVRARFAFDDPSSDLAVESVGDNDAEIHGPAYVADAAVGSNALQFDGEDDYVDAGNPAALGHTIPMTVSVWVKPSRLDRRMKVVHKQTSGDAGLGMMLRLEEGGTVAGFTGYGSGGDWVVLRSDGVVHADEWNHLAWTRGENGGALYVNGDRVASDGRAVEPYQSSVPFQIGARNAANRSQQFFAGAIDDVQYYHRALSANEVATIAV